jgi:SAM-dependent methyltransferase
MGRQESNPLSFDPAFFARLYELESKHFWFRARNQVIAAVMKRYRVATGPNARILEVGCGNGNVLSHLSRALDAEIWGGDLFAEALAFCQERTNPPLVQLDTYRLPFEGSLDAVCMFDVLEHLQADSDVLAEVHRALKPGGQILLTVPAYPRLWSYFDELSHHQRRYDKALLCQRLESAGFRVEMCSYYLMTLLPLVVAGRRLRSRKHSDVACLAEADLQVVPVVNELLYRICGAEKGFVSRVGLPFGTSLIAVGRSD